MYITIPELNYITIEHTNKCNLRCPQCARTSWKDGGVNPNLKMTELKVEDYKRFASPEFYKNIPIINFTGGYGDAIASSNFLEVVRFIVDSGTNMVVQTNGALRDNSYYEQLAEMFGDVERRGIEFAIDGLEDTYHMYRKGGDFNKVMEHAKAYINAGGNARWNVILFDHIKHQKDEMIQRAKDMGFKSMVIKKVTRSLPINKNYYKNLYERVYFEDDDFGSFLDKYGNYANYANTCKVECVFKNTGQLCIDHQLNLWPCTPMATTPYLEMDDDHILKKQISDLYIKYGEGFNSLRDKTIDEVLQHPWFKNDLEESWCNTISDENSKLILCAKTCGDYIKITGCASENREKLFFGEEGDE
jgi:MoaA/NifB/PqqE/SkfB family radical SAM enzyme